MSRLFTAAATLTACLLWAPACDDGTTPYLGSVPHDPQPSAREIRCTQEFGDAAASPYRLPYPVGRTYRIIQSYCPSNPAWGHHDWLAYDFDLSIGDTILASRAGTVFAVRDTFEDGTRVCGEENWIFIEHEDGSAMQYVHLTRHGALVRDGDQVAQGQAIGLSGDSGCSSGPHLHVALFRDRTNYGAENTIPLNYRNANGPLDLRHGLIERQRYEATP